MVERRAALIGNGGHGRDVLEIMGAARWQYDGTFDDDPTKALAKPEMALTLGLRVLIAVNDPQVRARLHARLMAAFPDQGFSATSLVHPSVIFGPTVTVGQATVFAANVVMTTFVHVGHHTHINVAATVSQGSRVGNFCTIGPGARICGDVLIGDRVFIGAGAVISNTAHVNDDAVIGAGAVVLPGQTVPHGKTYVGVPAREVVR